MARDLVEAALAEIWPIASGEIDMFWPVPTQDRAWSPKPARCICSQQRHHDAGPTAAGRGRTLSRTPPSLLLSGAPAQHTAEQFVAKSYDVALPGVSGCALDL